MKTTSRIIQAAGLTLACLSMSPVWAGYTITRETQGTLTVNGPSGTATASTTKGFVFSATNMSFTTGARGDAESAISTGSTVNNFNAYASQAAGTESKLSISISTPDNAAATGTAAAGTITLPGFSTQTYTAGGNGAGLSFNISPAGVITPPPSLNPGTGFTSKRSSSLTVF